MTIASNLPRSKHLFIITACIFLAITGIFFNEAYKQQIFPTINTPINLSKQEAIDKALILNKKSTIGLPDSTDLNTAASYVTESNTNNYLSLSDKSNTLLNQSIQNKNIHSSYWAVRLFISKTIQENMYYFAPDGSQLGYAINLAEDKALPNLTQKQATKLAQKTLDTYKIQGINPSD